MIKLINKNKSLFLSKPFTKNIIINGMRLNEKKKKKIISKIIFFYQYILF